MDKTIDDTIQKAVKEAIREYKKEDKEEQKQKVLHNTKLLMKHYNSLKLHADNAVYSVDDIEEARIEEHEDIKDRTYILSIRRSRVRTAIMVSHIDAAMEELKNKKKEEGTLEQYIAFKMYYIDKKSYDEIQKELNCSKNTPFRWINGSIKDLSILLFGLDGLRINDLG
ncbi:MAG: DUF1492 domain-containing protein [Clostridium sp.]|uniref:DUF1492 domain-containing protein n=1 Tax=Clostridium sp. TaxID=1506 RepID=UPI003F2B217E